MRSIAILAACATLTVGIAPMVAQAQTATTNTSSTSVSPEVKTMWEKFKGSWQQTKGDVLVGKIQTRYGISHEQAEAQVSGWETKHKDM